MILPIIPLVCFFMDVERCIGNISVLSAVTHVSQDGRAVQGAAFRSQSGLPGVGSNPTSDMLFISPSKKFHSWF